MTDQQPPATEPAKPKRRAIKASRADHVFDVYVEPENLAARTTITALVYRAIDLMEWREKHQGIVSMDWRAKYFRLKLAAPTDREAHEAIAKVLSFLERMADDPPMAMRWVANRLLKVAGADPASAAPAPVTTALPGPGEAA